MISSCRTKSIRITPGSPRLNGPGTCAGVSTPMKTESSLPGHATRYAEDRAEDRGAGPRACLGPRLAHAPHPYGAGVLVGRQGDHRYLRQAGLAAVRLRRRFVVWGPRGARAAPVGILLAEDTTSDAGVRSACRHRWSEDMASSMTPGRLARLSTGSRT